MRAEIPIVAPDCHQHQGLTPWKEASATSHKRALSRAIYTIDAACHQTRIIL